MDNLRPKFLDNVSPVWLGLSLKGEEPPAETVETLTEKLNAANEKISTLESAGQNWKEGIDKDYNNNPNLQKFEHPGDLFNSYLQLQKKVGADTIRVPKGPEDNDVLPEFRKALGVPEKAEEYKFPEIKRPEGFPADEKQVQQFQQMAHKYGLAPWQAEGLYKEVVEANVNKYNELSTQKEQTAKQVESELQQEFGAAWADKKEMAQKVIDAYAPKNFDIGEKILTDPGAVRLLVKIGEKFSEDGLLDSSGGTGRKSPKECRDEINKILSDSKHPYHNNDAAGHKEAVEYMTDLYKMEAAGNAS